MMKKKILIGMAVVFTVVASFGARAAAPSPRHEEPEIKIVQFMSDHSVQAEVINATSFFGPFYQEVVTRTLGVLQEYAIKNAIGITRFRILPEVVLPPMPDLLMNDLEIGVFEVLASANDNEKVAILLAIAGFTPDGRYMEEDITDTVVGIVLFMQCLSTLSSANVWPLAVDGWDSLRDIPGNMVEERALPVDVDAVCRARMAMRSAIDIQGSRHEPRGRGAKMTKIERRNRKKFLMRADIDVTSETLCPTRTDEQDWAERVDTMSRVWLIVDTLIGNDVRRRKSLCDLLAAMCSVYKQLTVDGCDEIDLTELHLETGMDAITVREAYESYRTILWLAKQCYETARIMSLLTPTEPESSWFSVMGVFTDIASMTEMPNDRRTLESLMMVAILIFREEPRLFVFANDLVKVGECGVCWPPLPNGAAILHVCEDMRRVIH
ncbi:MAG: hypothetical protein LBT03_00470 [Holosporales bacterium]|nr:hypothetical protein [Holosporales bacterium]